MQGILTKEAVIAGRAARILLHGGALLICQSGLLDRVPHSDPQDWSNQRHTDRGGASEQTYDQEDDSRLSFPSGGLTLRKVRRVNRILEHADVPK
jgi:hypothetical protein